MKIIQWNFQNEPETEYVRSGRIMFFDHMYLFDCEVGDMIHRFGDTREDGTACYVVEEVYTDIRPSNTLGTTMVIARPVTHENC